MHKLHVILQTHTITVWTFLILFYRQPVTAAFYSAAAGHDCPPAVHRKKHNDIGYERTLTIILKVKKNRWSLYSPAIFALISKHLSIPVKVTIVQQLRGWLQSETRQTLHCLVLRRCCRSFHYDETPQRPSAQCNMDHHVLEHSACFVARATAMKERPHRSLGLAWWPLLGPTAKAVCLLNCRMGKDSAGTGIL